LILQRIADGSSEEACHILVDIGVLAAESRNGHDHGRLHRAQTIGNFPKPDHGALRLGRR
jgi:hypothetical protein